MGWMGGRRARTLAARLPRGQMLAVIDDQAGRILALESSATICRAQSDGADLLLRALLTHIALTDPQAFQGLISGFSQSGFFAHQRLTGELTHEVAEILTGMFGEIAERVEATGKKTP